MTTLAGGGGTTAPGYVNGLGTVAKFNGPRKIACDSVGNIFLADSNNNLIRMISSSGTLLLLLLFVCLFVF